MTRAVVLGGGIAGLSAATALSEAGVETVLLERDSAWTVAGAGITITGPTLRAMRHLGIEDAVRARGHTADGIVVYRVDGTLLSTIDTDTGDPATRGAGGIMRPALHEAMIERLRRSPAALRLGVEGTLIDVGGDGPARVRLPDGSVETFDLAVVADGIHSRTKAMVMPGADAIAPTGQICWRLMAPTPEGVDRRTYFLGGPVKVGLTPVSRDAMYMYVLERAATRRRSAAANAAHLASLVDGYGGAIATVRDAIDASSVIVVRPLETGLAPWPWHRGRAVLIGDAAHATTPQLASGAGMAIEDGLVLAEEVARAGTVAAALDAFAHRRFARCRLVVDSSIELGRLEMRGADPSDNQAVIETALAALAQPY